MPAPRGVPKIEVTFDIDANGILSRAREGHGDGQGPEDHHHRELRPQRGRDPEDGEGGRRSTRPRTRSAASRSSAATSSTTSATRSKRRSPRTRTSSTRPTSSTLEGLIKEGREAVEKQDDAKVQDVTRAPREGSAPHRERDVRRAGRRPGRPPPGGGGGRRAARRRRRRRQAAARKAASSTRSSKRLSNLRGFPADRNPKGPPPRLGDGPFALSSWPKGVDHEATRQPTDGVEPKWANGRGRPPSNRDRCVREEARQCEDGGRQGNEPPCLGRGFARDAGASLGQALPIASRERNTNRLADFFDRCESR